MSSTLKDSYGRAIRDLRVSLTDRCNFRCFYCLPHGEPPIAPKEQMLSYEEIEYVCDVFVSLGIQKIRLTGGEPMMRRDIETIIGKLSLLKPKGLQDLALTTNGYFLPDRARSLKAAGLDRITISVDSLKPETFKQMTGVDVLDRVLAGIAAAKQAGLEPIKINAVIVRGHNEDEVADFAAFAREHDVGMRFIEFMPLDSGHDWSRADVVSGREIRERIDEKFPLVPMDVARGSETSSRFRFADGAPGEIGIIAPVTEPFCGACSRIRLTADGIRGVDGTGRISKEPGAGEFAVFVDRVNFDDCVPAAFEDSLNLTADRASRVLLCAKHRQTKNCGKQNSESGCPP